jgi:hypothetical protein
VHHPPPSNHHNQVNGNGNGHAHQPNGNSHHQNPAPHRSTPSTAGKEPIVVVGIPSVSIQNNQLQVGNSQSSQYLSFVFRPLIPAYICKQVSLSLNFCPRLDTFVQPAQGSGGWIVWYCLVVRLAWDATAQYTFIPNAMWSWS